MLGNYYYHEIIKKTIVSFGTLFNQIYIRHPDKDGNTYSEMRVPLAYGPMQKFLARIEQQSNLSKPVQITLPRMSFEMISIGYDATRKTSVTQTFKTVDNNNRIQKVFMPVPYNIGFELNILSKLNDDALQIVEQILPYFQPAFNITVDLVDSIGEKRDLPVVLEDISFQDDYEGDFSTRRALIYKLNFSVKTYLFGPIADTTDGLIRKVQVDYYSDVDTIRSKRELRYTSTPKALKDYNNDNTSGLREDLTDTETRITVASSASLSIGERIVIDSEIMKIVDIPDSSTIIVKRGYDGTISSPHISSTPINVLSAADDVLINIDDDFGFNDDIEFFQDSKTYSPTQQKDI